MLQIIKEQIMNNQSTSDRLSVVAAALLLILTPWGNATVMLIVAILGLLVAMLFIFRENKTRGGALAATVGLAIAIGISLMKLLR
jgi:hypothetical protein